MPTGEWNEWGRHVLAELKRVSSEMDGLRKEHAKTNERISKIEGKLTIMKLKMSGIGAVIGAAIVKVLHQ